MEIEEIQKLNIEDFNKLVDAESDRRVNQARETWEKRLPAEAEKIAVGIIERKEREKDFKTEIENKLTGEGIPIGVGMKLLGKIGVDMDSTILESKISEVKEQFIDIQNTVMKAKFGGDKPPRALKGIDSLKSLASASSQEILDNLAYYAEE